MYARIGSERHVDFDGSELFGIMVSGSVGIAAGYIVPHVQRTILALTPITKFQHTWTVSGSTGFQEPVVPLPIIRAIIADHDDTIQVQIHLFEQGVPQVVGDAEELGIGAIRSQ